MSGGGSLLLAILFSGILYSIGASFVGFRAACDLHMLRIAIREKLMDNAESGIHLLLINPEFPGSSSAVDLFGEETDSVILIRKPWGVYEVLSATAFHHRDTFRLQCLTGDKPENPSLALYLPNSNFGLTLSGKTRITGNASIPEKGVKRGNTENQPFQGTELVNGTVSVSTNTIPEIPKQKIDVLREFILRPYKMGIPSVLTDSSLHQPFSGETYCLNVQGLVLDGYSFSGNIVLFSASALTIPASCALSNVIVVAPAIMVENDFKGSCQMLAKDSIVIGKNATLSFPSVAIVAVDKEDNPERHAETIRVEEGAFVGGALLMLADTYVHRRKPFIHVRPSATVNGLIYSAFDCMFSGTCNGTLIAQRIRYQSVSGSYTNHLLNATLNAIELREHMIFPVLFAKTSPKLPIRYLQ